MTSHSRFFCNQHSQRFIKFPLRQWTGQLKNGIFVNLGFAYKRRRSLLRIQLEVNLFNSSSWNSLLFCSHSLPQLSLLPNSVAVDQVCLKWLVILEKWNNQQLSSAANAGASSQSFGGGLGGFGASGSSANAAASSQSFNQGVRPVKQVKLWQKYSNDHSLGRFRTWRWRIPTTARRWLRTWRWR